LPRFNPWRQEQPQDDSLLGLFFGPIVWLLCGCGRLARDPRSSKSSPNLSERRPTGRLFTLRLIEASVSIRILLVNRWENTPRLQAGDAFYFNPAPLVKWNSKLALIIDHVNDGSSPVQTEQGSAKPASQSARTNEVIVVEIGADTNLLVVPRRISCLLRGQSGAQTAKIATPNQISL